MFNFLGAARRGGAGLIGGLTRNPMQQQSPGMGGMFSMKPHVQSNPIGGFTGAKGMFPQPSMDAQAPPMLGAPSPEMFSRLTDPMEQLLGSRRLGGVRNLPMSNTGG